MRKKDARNPKACYAGRSEGVVPCNFSLDREAYDFLASIVPTRKGFGRIISRLLLEERARMEQRAEMREAMQPEVEWLIERCTGSWPDDAILDASDYQVASVG